MSRAAAEQQQSSSKAVRPLTWTAPTGPPVWIVSKFDSLRKSHSLTVESDEPKALCA